MPDNLAATYPQDMSNSQNDRHLGQHSQVRSDITVDRRSKLKRRNRVLGKGNAKN